MKTKGFSTVFILVLLVMSFVPSAGAAPPADDGPIIAGRGVDQALEAPASCLFEHGKLELPR